MDIHGTSAIVTGAASGLGAATAHALADAGAHVLALDLAFDGVKPVAGVTQLSTDVTDPIQVGHAVAEAATAAPLRIAVNCAGIGPSARIVGRAGTHDFDLFAKVVSVNLVGTFTVLTLAADEMAHNAKLEDGQRGVVINTASIAAYDGQIGQTAYASSKGGVVSMTLPAARDLARHGIRVNTIAPGIVETPMLATVSEEYRVGLAEGVPFPQRLARPEEFALLVTQLIAHDYINGEVVRMDGALRMAPR